MADVVCEDRTYGYWEGINALWDSDQDLILVEHDMEFSDDLVAELLSCPHPTCAYPYVVMPVGWPGKTWSASYGSLWVAEDTPYASFSSIGFCKLTAEARRGTDFGGRAVWNKVEGSVHLAAIQNKCLWHLHWPAIQHHHDYAAINGADLEAGSLYNVVKRARDEGRLHVYGDPMTDECLEALKRRDPLIYDKSWRDLAEKVCID